VKKEYHASLSSRLFFDGIAVTVSGCRVQEPPLEELKSAGRREVCKLRWVLTRRREKAALK